jgi:UDP-N-acetylglucosamine diphosphorylase/glucosamine-1-phosphate N-acetyltransferase
MNYILFEDHARQNLLPFTFTRPISSIRIGILTIHEKWEKHLNTSVSNKTEEYLSVKFPLQVSEANNIWINGKICPNEHLVTKINNLKPYEILLWDETVVAFNSDTVQDFSPFTYIQKFGKKLIKTYIERNFINIDYVWHIFSKNAEAIKADFDILSKGKRSQSLSSTNTIIGDNPVFLEAGAKVKACILNTTDGPIYLAKNSEVMEGSMIRGPFALGENAQVKMGTKIYGGTTIGPESKVGGEVSNSVIFGYSNKAHDGFLGNSVIGEWCNLGADTNNSNLKNNYSTVKIWNYAKEEMIDSGLQFCGLMMGDHSKTGINTMLNTGTVVGVNSNIFGGGFPPTFVASYSWGGAEHMQIHKLDQALETSERVYARRNVPFTEVEKDILKYVFRTSVRYRHL